MVGGRLSGRPTVFVRNYFNKSACRKPCFSTVVQVTAHLNNGKPNVLGHIAVLLITYSDDIVVLPLGHACSENNYYYLTELSGRNENV